MHTFPHTIQGICCFYIVSHLCTFVNTQNTILKSAVCTNYLRFCCTAVSTLDTTGTHIALP